MLQEKKNSKKEPETSSFQETKKINNEKISVKKYCEQDEQRHQSV